MRLSSLLSRRGSLAPRRVAVGLLSVAGAFRVRVGCGFTFAERGGVWLPLSGAVGLTEGRASVDCGETVASDTASESKIALRTRLIGRIARTRYLCGQASPRRARGGSASGSGKDTGAGPAARRVCQGNSETATGERSDAGANRDGSGLTIS